MTIKCLSICGKSAEELLSLFFISIEKDDDYYHRIALEICRLDNKLLLGIVNILSENRLRATIFALSSSGSNDMTLYLSFLKDRRKLVVSSAIDALALVGYTDWNGISRFLSDNSPFVRGAALRFAGHVLGSSAYGIISEYQTDTSSIVRQNVLDELCDLGDKRAIEIALSMLNDNSKNVRVAAKSLLDHLSN